MLNTYRIVTWTKNCITYEEVMMAKCLQEVWTHANDKYAHKDHLDVYQICPVCGWENHLEERNIPICEQCGILLQERTLPKEYYLPNHHSIGIQNIGGD